MAMILIMHMHLSSPRRNFYCHFHPTSNLLPFESYSNDHLPDMMKFHLWVANGVFLCWTSIIACFCAVLSQDPDCRSQNVLANSERLGWKRYSALLHRTTPAAFLLLYWRLDRTNIHYSVLPVVSRDYQPTKKRLLWVSLLFQTPTIFQMEINAR